MRIFLMAMMPLFLCQDLMAQQFPFEFWHEGRAILESGDTLKGKIKYDPQNDLIQLERNSKFETLTSRKIIFYEIFDAQQNNYRQFFALPYSPSGGYKTPSFFELLAEGKITLLCKESVEYRSSNAGFYYGSVSRLVLVYKYFLLKEDGTIERVNGAKNDFIDMMGSRAEEVRKYMKANRLGLERKEEIGRVISYYNSLHRK
ncbi:MAG: hypothetical protein ACO3FI_10835 [Cyclobacteriaceae bacterium]